MPKVIVDDCGLACLAIMLSLNGIAVDQDQLLQRFACTRLNHQEIIRGAREHGLKAKVVSLPVRRLAKTVLPAIFRIRDGAFQILAKIMDSKVLLHDPVNGRPTSMELDAFEALWDGTLVLMTRRADLSNLARRFDISWFLQAMQKYRRLLYEVLLASFFLQVFALIASRGDRPPLGARGRW